MDGSRVPAHSCLDRYCITLVVDINLRTREIRDRGDIDFSLTKFIDKDIRSPLGPCCFCLCGQDNPVLILRIVVIIIWREAGDRNLRRYK